ncbi:NAD-dependent epimerase/dehydratase family protein [Pseudoalteromonas sp. S4498]|uniref:UDP-glucose 4-epimerase family protein n=1 Tax=Pseudoalteromonas galatheae TaxID=579562 RepID=UPI0011096123|nr:SDR family oxidoreductase [Pseudoalteromonas galatheae]NKC17463.1 NAD-dependent epimerase/dehydratase family protein [Pseudoalteromonas galatheae]
MNNVLITGATGFIGKNLTKIINDSYSLKLLSRSGIQGENHYNADIAEDTDYLNLLNNVEVVVHCAARVHIMDDLVKEPLSEFRAVNTAGTLNLAKQSAQVGVKRFIFVSTIKVNGESTTGKSAFTSLDTPKPEDFYGVSKSEAELLLMELGKQTGMEIVIIRPPLVYGEGVKANFASLMKLVSKGLPLPFRLINNNKRSLVSVYNLVDLIKVCIEHPKAANQIFLVSDDNDISTAEMVSLMARVQSKPNLSLPVPLWCFNLVGRLFGKQEVVDRLTGSLQIDITHTKNTLGWKPPYSIEHGFKLSAKN